MFAYAFGYLHLHRLAIGVVDFNTEALQFINGLVFNRKASMKKAIIMISNIMILS